MNGLTDLEKYGLRHLLETNNDSNLIIQLAKNLVGNTITVDDTEEAYRIIFLHSSDIHEILSKRILTKEVLFKYLHKNEYPVRSDFSKVALISKILEFWNNQKTDTNDITVQATDTAAATTISPTIREEEIRSSTSTATATVAAAAATGTTSASAFALTTRATTQVLAERTSTASNSNSNNPNEESEFPINKMARQFSEWFFQKYNDYSLCIDDFWLDSQLDLRILTPDNLIENQYMNREIILETLNNIRIQYDFYFNPTMSHDGVQGRLDIHGLALVLVCGTLHNHEKCVGIFETVFSLARDPYTQNNWKIKKIQLLLRSTSLNQNQLMPNLADSEAMQNVLNLPVSSNDI